MISMSNSDHVSTVDVAAAERARNRDSMVDELTRAEKALRESTKIAADRIRSFWDEDTRTYNNPDEVDVLHGIINKNVTAVMAIRFAIREANKGTADTSDMKP